MDAMQKYAVLIGKVVDDRYEILQVKGVGGMAVVLKARDRLKNRIVALKMLNEKNSNDSAAIRRFVNESRAIALLSSEHIVDIYDVALTGKIKYIVMEYIDGITLREYMKRNAPIGIDRAIDFTMQILSALQHAHEKGVVHRDIKPQNIMVQSNGKLKVTDFGIAQISDVKQASSGVAMGTVYYISPEQASGKTTTYSSDLYSTGIMLYEMVTGRLPFEGDTPLSIAMMQVNNKPLRPRKLDPKIPQGLEQIILRAINKAPEDRFRSAKSMLRALDIIRKDKTVVFEDVQKNQSSKESPSPKTPTAKAPAEKKAQTNAPKKPKPKLPPTRHTMFPIILGVTTAFLLVLLITGIILLTSLISLTSEDNTVVVPIPALVGEALTDELKASLDSENIALSIKYVSNDHYENGQIVRQDPAAGQTRKIANLNRKVVVTIEVSSGKGSFQVPNLVNEEYRAAQIALQNLGATVQITEQHDNSVVAGHIVSITPKPGTTIKHGEVVTLYVSKGVQMVYADMIDVQGMDASEAKRKLLNSNFIVGEIKKEFSATVPRDHVISQSVAPGTSTAQKFTPVDLVISLGPHA